MPQYQINWNPAHLKNPIIETAEGVHTTISLAVIYPDHTVLHSPTTNRMIGLEHYGRRKGHPIKLSDYDEESLAKLSTELGLPLEELTELREKEILVRGERRTPLESSRIERIAAGI